MYHPNKYEEHNKSLNNLINIFNNTAKKLGSEIEMYYQEQENFRDDGGIIYKKTNEKVLYDFEKRHRYYDTCNKLAFKTLGQFERKIEKSEIKLSIQVCSDESCLVIAWHEDYKKEEKAFIKSATEDGKGESNAKRFTNDFIEIKYTNMEVFYKVLLKAFSERTFNKNSFDINLNEKQKKCESIGCNNILSEKVYAYSIKFFNGKVYCYNCQQTLKNA